MEAGEGRDVPESNRVQLRKMLLAGLGPRREERIGWSCGVKSTAGGSDRRIVITFQNDSTATGLRLVVRADGV